MSAHRPFRFAVVGHLAESGKDWAEKAKRAEALGYSSLVMPDHFVNPLTPIPGLAFAAAATSTLRIGAIVFANDFRNPALLAKETATLDFLSDGRFEFGIGAGWLLDEYVKAGIQFDPPGVRIARMREGLEIIRALWTDGPVTHDGDHYRIQGLEGLPKPVQKPGPPVFIGGTGKRMLQLAGREADIVGLLPKTLPHGGHDWAGSTEESLVERLAWVRAGAGERFSEIEFSNVAFYLAVTDQPLAVAETAAAGFGLDPRAFLASPDVLVGSVEGIEEKLIERRERFGISYVEIFDRDAIDFASVVAKLAGT
jgi:probable F420-dependent oxidoreductase